VTVTGLLWKNRLIPHRWVFQMPGESPLSAKFPVPLHDGEEASFSVPLEAWASDEVSADPIKRLIPRPRRFTVRFLRIKVRTSSGEFVSAPLEKELREWLLTLSQGNDVSARAKTNDPG
jgi:hypothetical protein